MPGIHDALLQAKRAPAKIAAISPIVGNAPVAGPAGILMQAQGLPCSIAGVAHAYEDFLDLLVCDTRDARAADMLRQSGLRVHCTQTVMRTPRIRPHWPGDVLSLISPDLLKDKSASAPVPPPGLATVILVPIKNTVGRPNSALASILDQHSRTRLAQAMLHDVLSALHEWKNRPSVGIVTSDPYATQLASEYKFEIIPDPENPGETGAIEMATQVCVERGEDSTLVIPADIPLIEPWELEEITSMRQRKEPSWFPQEMDAAPTPLSGVPRILFPLRFGNDSFKPHHAAAQATGQPCVILNLPGIAVDVDNPEDLHQLIALPGNTRAQQLAREYVRIGKMPSPA